MPSDLRTVRTYAVLKDPDAAWNSPWWLKHSMLKDLLNKNMYTMDLDEAGYWPSAEDAAHYCGLLHLPINYSIVPLLLEYGQTSDARIIMRLLADNVGFCDGCKNVRPLFKSPNTWLPYYQCKTCAIATEVQKYQAILRGRPHSVGDQAAAKHHAEEKFKKHYKPANVIT